jgi:hypothetical protein
VARAGRFLALTAVASVLVAAVFVGAPNAFASPPGNKPTKPWTCQTFTGSVDLSQANPELIGTLGGCTSAGNGALTAGFHLGGLPTPLSIIWSNNTSDTGTLQVLVDHTGAGCPAGAHGIDLIIELRSGFRAPASGRGRVCGTGFPIETVTGGPIDFA